MTGMNNQLPVIMSTEIVHSNHMIADPLSRVQNIRFKSHNIHKRWVLHYQGELVGGTGNKTLARFIGVGDAAACATTIQHEASIEGIQRLKVAIHCGAYFEDEEASDGNALETASDILDMTPPGVVYISDHAVKMMHDPTGFRITFVLEKGFSGVSGQMKLFRLEMKTWMQQHEPGLKQLIVEKDKSPVPTDPILSKRSFVLVTAIGMLSILALVLCWLIK